VSFDASGSTDSDGGIAGYRWNFGDGTVENVANPMVTHRFVHVGTYNVTLTVVDGDGGENVTAQNISVGKGPTHIDIIAPTSVRVEEPLTINAILLDEDGLPITGKQIEVEVFDGDLDISRNINTGALGMAATTLSLNATGQHAIRVSYAGSIDYLSSESTLTLSVNLMATSLELQAPENATQNSDVILSATLMGDDGNSIYNATVEFHVHNGNAWELLGISQTDQNGTARFGYTPTHTGTFKSRASYNGDWKHAASTSGEHSFTVVASGMDYVPYVLLGAMVASVAIVLLIVFTRRRGKSNQSER
jgi:PKD repeat protein